MSNIRWSIAVLAIVCGFPIASNADNANRMSKIYAYESIGSGNRLVIDEDRSAVFLGDFGIKATFCNSKSQYHCVSSDLFFFAVPKHLTGKMKTWNVDGHVYEVVTPLTIVNMFGTNLEACIIVSRGHTKHGGIGITYYYYSPQRGLLAFGTEVHPTTGDTVLPASPFPIISISSGSTGFAVEQ